MTHRVLTVVSVQPYRQRYRDSVEMDPNVHRSFLSAIAEGRDRVDEYEVELKKSTKYRQSSHMIPYEDWMVSSMMMSCKRIAAMGKN